MKKLTHDEFINKLKEKNPNIEILTTYIKSHEKVLCKCLVDNNEWYAEPSKLLYGRGCPICGYKSNMISHEDFIKRLNNINPNIEVLEEYRGSKTPIKIRCKVHGLEYEYSPHYLLSSKKQLTCCNGNSCVLGINDIATTHPEYIKFLKNKEDATKYSVGSGKKIDFICEYCGHVKNMVIARYFAQGIACPKCGKGESYPERFLASFFDSLHVRYKKQATFVWSSNKRYDFYLTDYNIIVEAHGMQHYKESNATWNSLEYQKRNDKEKKDLALKNGIFKYIEVDCRYSEKFYIMKQIFKSGLTKVFNSRDLDFSNIEKIALENKYKKICDIYNSGIKLKDIPNEINVSIHTARNALNFGATVGWCDYNGKSALSETCRETGLNSGHQIRCVENGMVMSATKWNENAIEVFGFCLDRHLICDVCEGKRENYKGLHFEYVKKRK